MYINISKEIGKKHLSGWFDFSLGSYVFEDEVGMNFR